MLFNSAAELILPSLIIVFLVDSANICQANPYECLAIGAILEEGIYSFDVCGGSLRGGLVMSYSSRERSKSLM